jgi:hypothetical protein
VSVDGACDAAAMADPRHQLLRILDGRYSVVWAAADDELPEDGEWLARVHGPDGHTGVRRDDDAASGWVAFWSGDEPHDPQTTGMLSAIVSPLAEGDVPVMAVPTFHADLVLVPADRVETAAELLRAAGHRVRT